jgi:hypothetical protein
MTRVRRLMFKERLVSKDPYQVDEPPIGILPFHDHHLARDLSPNVWS